jgi:HKD family nuclease
VEFLVQPHSKLRLGEYLLSQLGDQRWTEFRAAVAFVKKSGAQHLASALDIFDQRGRVSISVGIDLHGTSREGLEELLRSISRGRIWVFHNSNPAATFHPKVYLFKNSEEALTIIGSGNWTQGGLFTNYEGTAAVLLRRDISEDAAALGSLETTLDSWSQEQAGLCHRLTDDLMVQLVQSGYVASEAEINEKAATLARHTALSDNVPPEQRRFAVERLFHSVGVPAAPPSHAPHTASIEPSETGAESPSQTSTAPPSTVLAHQTFVISVLVGDLPQVGSSNEIRITKGIRDVDPHFWNWPSSFEGPHPHTGQYHRKVNFRMGDQFFEGYLKDFPAQKPDGTKASADFRMGSIAPIVQALNEEDDLVLLTKSTTPGIDFEAQVIRKVDPRYEEFAEGLIQHTRARSTATGTFKKYKYLP